MKFCSITGCGVSVTDAQAETSQKLFGKIVCVNHEKDASVDALKQSEGFTLDTAPYIKCGFTVENGVASKIIGQVEVTIDIVKKNAGKSNKETIQIGGYEYTPITNPDVDKELKTLFAALKGGAVEKKENKPAPANDKPEVKKMTDPKTEIVPRQQDAALTTEIILQYICPKATEAEAYNFLQLCKHRGLNPFLKEAYLVKYGDNPATMIVGKDAFTRKAEESGKLDGYETGIIVSKNDGEGFISREGTLLLKGEELIGGWAKVYRKDMSKPFEIRVSMQEYDKKKNNWVSMPATMIRKVALVQALREAFTKELGGCYDAAEVAPEVTQ